MESKQAKHYPADEFLQHASDEFKKEKREVDPITLFQEHKRKANEVDNQKR